MAARRATQRELRYPRGLTTVDDLRSLLRKYEEILRLRRAAAAATPSAPEQDPRRAMVALAAEFPGALREADDLAMADLEARVAALESVLRGDEATVPWMTAVSRFHTLTRGALCAKRWLGGRKTIDEDAERAFEVSSATLCYPSDAREWAGDLAAVAKPPRGRVTDLVFERIAGELDLDIDAVRALVLAPRARVD